MPLVIQHPRERSAQPLVLGSTPDQGRQRPDERARGTRRGARRRAGRAQDFTVELPRLVLRLRAELSLQPSHARLVLLQRRRSSTLTQQEPHQRAVDRLLEWVERENAQRRLDRAFRPVGTELLA